MSKLSCQRTSILNILDNSKFQSIVPKMQADSLRVDITTNSQLNEEIEKRFEELRQLTKDEKDLTNQFSKSRKLLSSALSQIDKTRYNHNCPVCDTHHQRSLLIEHIESKTRRVRKVESIVNDQK